MDSNSSLGKICLGDDVIVISSDKVEGSGDWNSSEYQDTAGSKGKNVMNAFSFYKIETDEVSERYISPCFVNGLEAYDGEINLAFNENLISNEYVVKLCLDHKVEPGVILGRPFMRLAKGIVDFRNGVITIYLEPDLFEDDSEKTKKSPDDWDQLHDFNFYDVSKFGEELPLLVCKMGKSSHNKKEINGESELVLSRYWTVLVSLWEHTMIRLDHHDSNALDNTRQWKKYCFHKFTMNFCYEKVVAEKLSLEIDDILRIRLREAGSDEEIFTSMAWIRAFNINEPIYTNLCHEFYSTYKFNKVCADDELQTMKIIKFRLGERAHSLTLLEFARRLGLYQAAELDEEGFNVYFEGGLCSDEHFNAQGGRLGMTKFKKNDLWLLSMFHTRHQNGYENVAWLIARKSRVLTKDVLRSLSALIYCRDLDTTTLKELIDSKSRLIPEDPQPGVPRVCIPRPLRASMQDLYDMMGRMEIRQEAIERMEYRQSYHWDRYQGVFEHMTGVYSVPLQGAYNPPGYAQPSMINIISSTHLHHHSTSSSRMMISVETTRVG
uniref:Uncharacterized protein n=1 Tax=Tanacetum cinerariifolium TaxID=118510 RepID=A0A6L2MCE0_TANCI|nr:hypothetical protein [Tanacetum cinerariifolium]